jgi:hypothetical protein
MPVPSVATAPKTARIHRVLAIALTSFAAACGSDTPVSPAPANIAGPMRTLATLSDTLMVDGVPSETALASTLGHVGFSTQGTSSWDDIRITHGTSVIVERFENGEWNGDNFELAVATRPGEVVDGEYRSSGTLTSTYAGALRTKQQFLPTMSTPLVIEATYRQRTNFGSIYNAIVWRGPGSLLPAASFSGIPFLIIPGFSLMGLGNMTEESLFRPITPEFLSTPTYVRIVDNGVAVSVVLTQNSTTPFTQRRVTSTGFRAPVSGSGVNVVKAGSAVPLKFQLTRDEEIVSDLSAVAGVSVAPTPCEVSPEDVQTVTASTTLPTGLRYDDVDQQFIYVWRTPREGGCHVATVTLADGDRFTARFNVRK